MPLTFGRTGLSAPDDGNLSDYVVSSGEWRLGLIWHESRDDEQSRRWLWAFHGLLAKPADMQLHGAAPSLQAARAEVEGNWRKWLAWAKLSETT